MQKPSPYLDPAISKAIEDISDAIEEAHAVTVETLHFTYIMPIETDQLTDALSEAIEALKTAYNLAQALRNPPHLDQR